MATKLWQGVKAAASTVAAAVPAPLFHPRGFCSSSSSSSSSSIWSVVVKARVVIPHSSSSYHSRAPAARTIHHHHESCHLSSQLQLPLPPELEDAHRSPRRLSSKPSKEKTPTPGGRGEHPKEEQEQVWSDDSEGWEEEEEEKEPQIGDGGDGGGIVLGDVVWGQRALSLANEVLHTHFQDSCSDPLSMFAFRVSPKGYIYLRLDKLSHKYGCPSIDEIEQFNRLYDEILEESGKRGEIPNNLAVEVSSPGAARLLRVPDDLERFKELPLVLKYLEDDVETKVVREREGIFFLVSVDNETKQCVWKLADVKENRDPLSKGRKLSREKREWRLNLPFQMAKSVTFYLNF